MCNQRLRMGQGYGYEDWVKDIDSKYPYCLLDRA